MQWATPKKYLHGDYRKKINKFLWFPISIDGLTRWWEYASWEEQYCCGDTYSFWVPKRWLDINKNGVKKEVCAQLT